MGTDSGIPELQWVANCSKCGFVGQFLILEETRVGFKRHVKTHGKKNARQCGYFKVKPRMTYATDLSTLRGDEEDNDNEKMYHLYDGLFVIFRSSLFEEQGGGHELGRVSDFEYGEQTCCVELYSFKPEKGELHSTHSFDFPQVTQIVNMLAYTSVPGGGGGVVPVNSSEVPLLAKYQFGPIPAARPVSAPSTSSSSCEREAVSVQSVPMVVDLVSDEDEDDEEQDDGVQEDDKERLQHLQEKTEHQRESGHGNELVDKEGDAESCDRAKCDASVGTNNDHNDVSDEGGSNGVEDAVGDKREGEHTSKDVGSDRVEKRVDVYGGKDRGISGDISDIKNNSEGWSWDPGSPWRAALLSLKQLVSCSAKSMVSSLAPPLPSLSSQLPVPLAPALPHQPPSPLTSFPALTACAAEGGDPAGREKLEVTVAEEIKKAMETIETMERSGERTACGSGITTTSRSRNVSSGSRSSFCSTDGSSTSGGGDSDTTTSGNGSVGSESGRSSVESRSSKDGCDAMACSARMSPTDPAARALTLLSPKVVKREEAHLPDSALLAQLRRTNQEWLVLRQRINHRAGVSSFGGCGWEQDSRCLECGRSFASARGLKSHMSQSRCGLGGLTVIKRKVTSVLPVEELPRRPNENEAQDHLLHQVVDGVSLGRMDCVLKCPNCSRSFTTARGMQNHIRQNICGDVPVDIGRDEESDRGDDRDDDIASLGKRQLVDPLVSLSPTQPLVSKKIKQDPSQRSPSHAVLKPPAVLSSSRATRAGGGTHVLLAGDRTSPPRLLSEASRPTIATVHTSNPNISSTSSLHYTHGHTPGFRYSFLHGVPPSTLPSTTTASLLSGEKGEVADRSLLGVHYCKKMERFMARLYTQQKDLVYAVNGKFDSNIEAAVARDELAMRLFGPDFPLGFNFSIDPRGCMRYGPHLRDDTCPPVGILVAKEKQEERKRAVGSELRLREKRWHEEQEEQIERAKIEKTAIDQARLDPLDSMFPWEQRAAAVLEQSKRMSEDDGSEASGHLRTVLSSAAGDKRLPGESLLMWLARSSGTLNEV